ncbi:NPC intracellular cholesterol transporter 1-like [Ylistrum balloti]|uniref:NPC intracellular cholesterol transporter 1-like n=1 Tax=Ylistrum balloti TaxID=509963 RepID=UPI002905F4EF|nr:NPC intracellular cholesterol transporter 1-like [Ylistrum balloti]
MYIYFKDIVYYVTQINGDTDNGHCIWYGECTDNLTGKQNCVYNGPGKPLTDPMALSRLEQYCPQLYTGNSSLTCCSASQLVTMETHMAVAKQLLQACPSCYYNFLNIFCFLTCNPHHSTSVGVKSQAPNDRGVATVLSVDYAMTTTFANGMYNSCKDVMIPGIQERAISVLCGRSATDCNATELLNYLGSSSNGPTPFEIDFHVQNTSWSRPGKYILKPMNTKTVPCDMEFGNLSACSYKDCPSVSPPLTPTLPNISVLYPWPDYRVEQLIITRPDNNTKVKHDFPAPAIGHISFSSLFDRTFLHLLLDLQLKIQNITTTYKGKMITLDDICYRVKSSESCVIISMLEYWQMDVTRLDQVVMDSFGFFMLADYLDHLQACVRTPNATFDRTKLNTTCLSTSSVPIDPWLVMQDGLGYPESETFVISFIVKNSQDPHEVGAAHAWEKAYTSFLTNFSSPNMTIKFSTKRPTTADPMQVPNTAFPYSPESVKQIDIKRPTTADPMQVPNTAFPYSPESVKQSDIKILSAAATPLSGVIKVLTFALLALFIDKL